MYNLEWSRKELNSIKLRMFCEYYAKMTLSSYGIAVYSSEVDDHGIDFVAEIKGDFLKFQVKSLRVDKSHYTFMRKDSFNINDQKLYLFLLLLNDDSHPDMYIIPSTEWNNPSSLLVDYDYVDKQSKPEYGIRISKKNMEMLQKYNSEKMIRKLNKCEF